MTLHTDIPSRTELERLITARDPISVSIYLPTSPLTQEAQADRIELKNLATEAFRQLEGADKRTVDEIREALDDLVDDDAFWASQARSLAVFASGAGVTTYRLPNQLTSTAEGIYRSVNSYPHLAAQGIAGSPEETTDAQLAEAARPVLDELYAQQLADVRALYEQRFAQGRASADLSTIARAATFGAVDTLLVDIDEKLPGYVDETSGAVTDAPDDASSYGVVDELARRVLLSGGRVLAVRAADVPEGAAVAAIFRYPV